MSLCARVSNGDSVELVGFDGRHFTLRGPNAYAPGQPLVVEVAIGMSHTLDLKSIGSKKLEQGGFEIRARFTTLTREARQALLGHFVSG